MQAIAYISFRKSRGTLFSNTEASKTVRNIDSVFVKDIKAHVKDGKISSYGVICKISFRLD